MTDLSEAALEELLLEMRGTICSKGEAIAIKPTWVMFPGYPVSRQDTDSVIRLAMKLLGEPNEHKLDR